MSLVEDRQEIADAADANAPWRKVTHRIGRILEAKVHAKDAPPYDPEPEWTEALKWSRGNGDEGEVDDGFIGNTTAPGNPLPAQGSDTKEVLLGIVRAKEAAKLVMRDSASYNRIVAEVIAAGDGLTLEFRDEKPTVRFDPGLIVDLPLFKIKRAAAEIASGRICLTVCMNESRSKIWTRISSSRDDAWGGDACEQVNDLVIKSRDWYNLYAEEIQKLYAQNISEALRSSGEERESQVSLFVKNKIEFISGDTAERGLARLSAAITNEVDFTRDELACEAADRLGHMIRCAPGMDLAKDGQNGLAVNNLSAVAAILRPTSSALGNGRYYFVPHRMSRGFRGVYAVRAQDENILFAGIASKDSDPHITLRRLGEPTRPILNSPSQHVTAELANTVAKYF